ncbi:MAG: HDIG domain-containing protein, partial [Planctomycetota bacterium]
ADREAAQASTPSYYSPNAPALTSERVRAELMRLYQTAVGSDTFETFQKALGETSWPIDERAYQALRAFAGEEGRKRFQAMVDALPLEKEYVVSNVLNEPRDPKSTRDFIRLEIPAETKADEAKQGDRPAKSPLRTIDIPLARLILQGNDRALRGSAREVARHLGVPALVPTAEAIILDTFRKQPTIVYNRERTSQAMREAAENTPTAMRKYRAGQVLVKPGVIGQADYALLQAERAAFQAFLNGDAPEARAARRTLWLGRAGSATLIAMLAIGLMIYTHQHQPRIFEVRWRTVAFLGLVGGCLAGARVLRSNWPAVPELIFGVPLLVAGILAIVYPRRFAMGVMSITALMVTLTVREDVLFFVVLLAGVTVAAHELVEIRSRTKLISTGVLTALVMGLATVAGGLVEGHHREYVLRHSLWAASTAMAAAFVLSGILPFIERAFRVATSLTLLEWRDPTRPLLQLLAREAPGTYNHSLVVGTLAEAACEAIGANGLLAQVGALYHDIGKIPKAEYFTENQEGQISRHQNLAPTMSLLIILGHVKDGIEMAKEYKLPRVLHSFIEEHHGTTVVRYFHHVASEKQPQIASGKHDREVPEAEFRYNGPKPRTRESAVLMLADGVEGAVRALHEPTAGRIESVVHQVVMDRLNDGQFDDCDITLKELHQVEESLVKSLCAIYHGRVAYPKSSRDADKEEAGQRPKQRVGV